MQDSWVGQKLQDPPSTDSSTAYWVRTHNTTLVP